MKNAVNLQQENKRSPKNLTAKDVTFHRLTLEIKRKKVTITAYTPRFITISNAVARDEEEWHQLLIN